MISEARAASFYQGTTSSSTPSMAKIQPLPATSSADECQRSQLQKQAAYTVWMKSLVFNGNGCTVYGADGSLAFRVDNYGSRGGREVFFMDRAGNTLIRIRRKSFGVFKRWEAFRYVNDGEEKPWFRVQKVQKNGAAVKMHGSGRTYGIHGCSCKSDYKISGAYGEVVAAVERKQTASGVVLGEDGCPDADSGIGGGSFARSGLGRRVRPDEPLLVMLTAEDFPS